MKYDATFGIGCGVSPGFGAKYPDYVTRTETISADNSVTGYQKAMDLANRFADDYLSNPEDDLTTVQLLLLEGPEGTIPIETSVVKRGMLEHLLFRED
ncbi:hypothetical protein HY639_02150 [Candidatus Woesearchaeota archaeon]|nr:hypothetical protein [Candidatus Woesearchaeota archaeon]